VCWPHDVARFSAGLGRALAIAGWSGPEATHRRLASLEEAARGPGYTLTPEPLAAG